MKRILLITFSLCLCLGLRAQTEVSGEVFNEADSKAIDGASLTLLRQGKALAFNFSDGKGHFRFEGKQLQTSDSIVVSCLGYARKRVKVSLSEPMKIVLRPEAFTLKEVNVRGNRVIGRADTTVYDLTRFASERDNTLRDVLRKLPGVDIKDNGEVQVNGKPISRFTVEGLDLTGGRYAQLQENIKAGDVKSAEVIEHDQPIKALRDKIFSDDVALNITMKASARDKLLLTLKPYALAGETRSVGGSANLMQIGKRRQLSYDAGYDRTGRDLMRSSALLATYRPNLSPVEAPQWLNIPALEAPIDAERLRFNTSQRYAINRLQKADDDHELRLSAHYMRSVERQSTVSEASYDLGYDAQVMTSQRQDITLRNDDMSFEVERKVNSDNAYGNDQITLSAQRADGRAAIGDTLSQRIRVPKVDFAASLYRLFTVGKGQLTLRSVADYHYAGGDLYVNEALSGLTTNLWHGAASIGWLRKTTFLTRQLTAFVSVQNINVSGNSPQIAASLTPYWQYKLSQWTLSLSARARMERYPHQGQTLLLWGASAFARWDKGRRSEWLAGLNYSENTASATDYALSEYRRDYRTWVWTIDSVPLTRSLYPSLEYRYKRPIAEFFLTANASAGRTWSDMASRMDISDGSYYYSLVRQPTQSSFLKTETSISKGFFALYLKTRLNASMTLSEGQQMTSVGLIDYRSALWRLQPNVEFAPSWGAVSYHADLQWQHSGGQSTLFDISQSLQLTSTLGPIDLTMSLSHYHNQLQEDRSINAFFADAKGVWRMRKLRLTLSMTNLFNKREYLLTRYSGVSTLTDLYILRGRELLLSAQFTL